MTKVHVKRNDFVYVLSGKDRHKTGKVLSVDAKKNRVVVEGVNMVTKHRKPSARVQQGGIDHLEGYVDASNVMLVCDKCKKPTKVKHSVPENGKRSRICKSCGETIEYGTDDFKN